MKKTILTIVSATILTIGGFALDTQVQTDFNLQEAIDYALQHNKDLKNARQELVKSERSIWEAISRGLPQADLLVDYLTYFNYELAFEFGGGDVSFTQDQINQAITNTLSQPQFSMLTPQDLNIHFAGSYFDQELQSMLPPSTILMSDQLTAKMQVSQMIFSGQYIIGIQTAKLGKIISQMALDNSEVGTKEAVINAYYLVLISEKSLDFVKQNLDNLKKIFEQTKKMVDAGMTEKIDADQFQVTVNQLENTRRMMERNQEIN